MPKCARSKAVSTRSFVPLRMWASSTTFEAILMPILVGTAETDFSPSQRITPTPMTRTERSLLSTTTTPTPFRPLYSCLPVGQKHPSKSDEAIVPLTGIIAPDMCPSSLKGHTGIDIFAWGHFCRNTIKPVWKVEDKMQKLFAMVGSTVCGRRCSFGL